MRRLLWLFGALALLLAALWKPNPILTAALLVWLLVPLLLLLFLLPARRNLRLRLETPPFAEKGKAFQFSVQGAFFGSITAELRVENALTGERTEKTVRMGEITLSSKYCGGLRCEIRRARLYEPFGVLSLPLSCAEKRRILVLPETFPVLVQIQRAPNCDGQDYAPDRRGDDRTEPFQLRDYVPGDALSQIHWKLSGKRGGLIVREASQPLDRSLLLLVERVPAADFAVSDAIAETAVSLCQAFCAAGIPVCLAWNGAQAQRRELTEEAQLSEAIAAFLCDRGSHCAAELYLKTYGAPTNGRLIYLTHSLPDCLEQLTSAVPSQVLLCTRDAAPEAVLAFSPETAAEVLREFHCEW